MRIGVNALYLIPGGVGGTEIYLRNLLDAIAEIDASNEFVIFRNRETPSSLFPAAPNFQVVELPVRAAIRPWRILYEQTGLPIETRRRRLDVLFNPGFTAPLWGPPPSVTVFHDLQHKRHPEHFRWFDLPFWRLLLWASARRSRRLIAVSESTRDDLALYYGRRADVIHHGVEREFFEIAKRRKPERFLLCVSTLHPHKNIERLIAAFRVPDMRLVIAGLRGFATARIEAAIRERRMEDRVELAGWVPRRELYDLYQRAWAFVYPSTFEGFGMPVLEAMAAGLPVACSSIPPLREVAAGTALYFDPLDQEDIARAIAQLAAGAPEGSQAARDRAAGFRWTRAARQTLDVLESAALLESR